MFQLACVDGGLCIFAAIAAGSTILGWLGLRVTHGPECDDDCQESHACDSDHEHLSEAA